MMRLGSLCTGYGGLDLPVAAHYGATTAWHAEIDKDAAKVLSTRLPGVPNLGDVTSIDAAGWKTIAAMEPVDIVCAGFPCQPFSIAGKRRGLDDERAIFPHILNAVGVLRPRVVVLENVPGILTHAPGIVAALAGLDYVGRAGVVRASDAGAPHRRARWFCVATHAGGQRYGKRQDDRTVGRVDRRHEETPRQRQRPRLQPDRRTNALTSDALDGRFEGVWPEHRLAQAPSTQPLTLYGPYANAVRRWEGILGRRAPEPVDSCGITPAFVEWMMGLDEWVTGLDLSRTAQLKMLGNGVVPQQAALALRLLT